MSGRTAWIRREKNDLSILPKRNEAGVFKIREADKLEHGEEAETICVQKGEKL